MKSTSAGVIVNSSAIGDNVDSDFDSSLTGLDVPTDTDANTQPTVPTTALSEFFNDATSSTASNASATSQPGIVTTSTSATSQPGIATTSTSAAVVTSLKAATSPLPSSPHNGDIKSVGSNKSDGPLIRRIDERSDMGLIAFDDLFVEEKGEYILNQKIFNVLKTKNITQLYVLLDNADEKIIRDHCPQGLGMLPETIYRTTVMPTDLIWNFNNQTFVAYHDTAKQKGDETAYAGLYNKIIGNDELLAQFDAKDLGSTFTAIEISTGDKPPKTTPDISAGDKSPKTTPFSKEYFKACYFIVEKFVKNKKLEHNWQLMLHMLMNSSSTVERFYLFSSDENVLDYAESLSNESASRIGYFIAMPILPALDPNQSSHHGAASDADQSSEHGAVSANTSRSSCLASCFSWFTTCCNKSSEPDATASHDPDNSNADYHNMVDGTPTMTRANK